MRIDVRVIAGARKNVVKKTEGGITVYVTAPAIEGKANKALVNLLAEDFRVAKNRITIVKGLKSRHKTIEINTAP